MKTIGARVSDKYYDKIFELSEKRNEHIQDFIIDSIDRRLIELGEMKITRVFKPTIRMGENLWHWRIWIMT